MKQRPGLAAWDYCVLVTAHTPDLLSLCCRAARARIRFGELCTGKRAVQHQVSISYTACRLALSASPEHPHPHPRVVRKTTRRLCVCVEGEEGLHYWPSNGQVHVLRAFTIQTRLERWADGSRGLGGHGVGGRDGAWKEQHQYAWRHP